jgi:hypothetical protein
MNPSQPLVKSNFARTTVMWQFPANREKYRKFCGTGRFVRKSVSKMLVNSIGCTVDDWTSTSRNITNPYALVFKLRADDGVIPNQKPTMSGTAF